MALDLLTEETHEVPIGRGSCPGGNRPPDRRRDFIRCRRGRLHRYPCGGWAGWTENGDTLTVCDLSSDGYGVRGYIYTPNSSSDPGNGTVLIKGNDPSNDGNCATFAKDLSETSHISIKVCEYAGDVVTACRYTAIR